MSLEVVDEAVIIHTLQILIRIELIFEFTIVLQEGLIYHKFEIFSCKGFACVDAVDVHEVIVQRRLIYRIIILNFGDDRLTYGLHLIIRVLGNLVHFIMSLLLLLILLLLKLLLRRRINLSFFENEVLIVYLLGDHVWWPDHWQVVLLANEHLVCYIGAISIIQRRLIRRSQWKIWLPARVTWCLFFEDHWIARLPYLTIASIIIISYLAHFVNTGGAYGLVFEAYRHRSSLSKSCTISGYSWQSHRIAITSRFFFFSSRGICTLTINIAQTNTSIYVLNLLLLHLLRHVLWSWIIKCFFPLFSVVAAFAYAHNIILVLII